MYPFSAGDYIHRLAESQQAIAGWLAEGKLVSREWVTDGIENASTAFLGMMSGENIGKALVRVS